MKDSSIFNKLENAVTELSEQVNKISPVINWEQQDEEKLWYELVACILGSRVKFELAQSAVHNLECRGLLNFYNNENSYSLLEGEIIHTLSSAIYPPIKLNGLGSKYPYPKLRAQHIRKTAENIYLSGKTLKDVLKLDSNPYKVRDKLVQSAIGIGPKQASLFLRNIGFDENLAILDSHVLKYMYFIQLLPNMMKSISSLVSYEEIERILQEYAYELRIKLSCLDTAIWVVMKVFQEEYAI